MSLHRWRWLRGAQRILHMASPPRAAVVQCSLVYTINKRCFFPPTLTEPKMVDVDKMIENGKETFYPAYSGHFSGICKMQYHVILWTAFFI